MATAAAETTTTTTDVAPAGSASVDADAAAVTRRPFVGGNWKCNGTTTSVSALVEVFNAAKAPNAVDVAIFPPALFLDSVKSTLRKDWIVGAQNCWKQTGFGAYTGELTPTMLKDFGISTVLVGHSERRHVVGEDDAILTAKTKAALEAGMTVIYCVGETLDERQAGKTMEVLRQQVGAVVDTISAAKAWSRVVVAYEPVWAIGTGHTATAEEANDVHAQLRQWLCDTVDEATGRGLRILYGGSVKPANCKALFAGEHVDGFLVGGCSLKTDLIDIIASCCASD